MKQEELNKIFNKFLAEYLKNVQKELPTAYRAQQLKAGGMEAALVYEFETRFLKEPFMRAIKGVMKWKLNLTFWLGKIQRLSSR